MIDRLSDVVIAPELKVGTYYDNGTLVTKTCRLDMTRQICYQ